MSIKRISSTESQDIVTEISLHIDNGDFQALKSAIEQYNFKDEEALIRFALFVLLQAENNGIFIEQGGMKKQVNPNPASLKDQNQ